MICFKSSHEHDGGILQVVGSESLLVADILWQNVLSANIEII